MLQRNWQTLIKPKQLSVEPGDDPKRVATSKRTRKVKTAKGYVEGRVARAHVATARVMAKAMLPS